MNDLQRRVSGSRSAQKNLSRQTGRPQSTLVSQGERKTALCVLQNTPPLSPPFSKPQLISPSWPTNYLLFPHSGSTRVPNFISRCGKSHWWSHLHCTSRACCGCTQHCTASIHGSSCGSGATFYLYSAQIGWWNLHGFPIQQPPHDQRDTRIHWCVEARWAQDLPTANGVSSQRAQWSGPNDRAGRASQVSCDPETLASLPDELPV